MSRNTQNHGYIRKVDNEKDKWDIFFVWEHPINKQRVRKQKRFTGKKADAEKLLRKTLSEMDNGFYIPLEKLTVARYLDRWLASKQTGDGEKQVTPKTLWGYRQRITTINQIIGDLELKSVTPSVINDFVGQLKKRNPSTRTVQFTLRILKTSLATAVKWDLIIKNPAEHLVIGSQSSPKRQPLNKEQVGLLLEQLQKSKSGLIVEFILSTGLRKGEALGLKWTDFNFNTQEFSVKRSVVDIGNKNILKETLKNDSSRRTLPLSTKWAAKLITHRDVTLPKYRQSAERRHKDLSVFDDDFVFITRNGTLLGHRNVQTILSYALYQAGLPSITVHDLRHTFATLLLEGGTDIKTLSQWLGHQDVQTTMNIYLHPTKKMNRQVSDLADDFLTF